MIIIIKTSTTTRKATVCSTAVSIAMPITRITDNKQHQHRWCNRDSRSRSSVNLVKMCNQTTSTIHNHHRKCRNLQRIRQKLTNSQKITSHFVNFSDHQIKFITIAATAITFLAQCAIIAASTTTNSAIISKRSPTINYSNDPRYSAWNDFQQKMLHQRSVPAYQSPQDFGDILTQLGFLIQSRQRNASELAANIFFKYYNT